MKKIAALVLTGVFFLAGCKIARPHAKPGAAQKPPVPAVVIHSQKGDATYDIEIADTPEERAHGLMDRTEMAKDRGMVFVFEQDGKPSFWMKNTLIPLDMLFITADGTVDTVHQSVPPCAPNTKCATYAPQGPVRYVLELNAGEAEKRGMAAGDTVELELK